MPTPLTEQQILRRAIELERKMGPEDLGFKWKDIPAMPATINKMVVDGVLTVSYDSSTSTYYRLKIPIEEAESLLEPEKPLEAEEGPVEIPGDMFAPLVGFDDVKEFIIKSLKAEKPVHVLIISPPATAAKSTILNELERINGAIYISLGGTATRAGLRNVIAETPRILLLDEIDKCSHPLDLSALMTWMESGRVTIAKDRDMRDIKGKGWVFAASNSTRGINPALLSRFAVFNIPPYKRDEYMEVVRRVLTMREGTDPELAGYIAERMANEGFRDVRDCVRLARLGKTRGEVDGFLETMRRYR